MTPERTQKIKKVLRHKQTDLTVVCENIADAHNVSAIIRTCDAVGIPQLHLLYEGQEFPGLHHKSSASARKWMDTKFHKDRNSLRKDLKAAGMTIYGTHLSHNAVSIFDIDWTQPSAIIMGNEHDGVSEDILEITDKNVFIPMFGMIQSLNVSVATAVILYEVVRQRMVKGKYPNEGLSEEWLSKKIEEWANIK